MSAQVNIIDIINYMKLNLIYESLKAEKELLGDNSLTLSTEQRCNLVGKRNSLLTIYDDYMDKIQKAVKGEISMGVVVTNVMNDIKNLDPLVLPRHLEIIPSTPSSIPTSPTPSSEEDVSEKVVN